MAAEMVFAPLPMVMPTELPPDVVANEPSYPTAFTIVNGLIDAPRIQLCLGDAEGTWSGTPFPPGGLDYGDAVRVPGMVAAGIVSDGATWVVLRDPVADDADCGELAGAGSQARPGDTDASASDERRVAALASIPAGALTSERAYLMALSGCLGGTIDLREAATELGRAEQDLVLQATCGPGYTKDQPSATALLAQTSRVTRYDAVGIQFFHASLGTGSLDLRSYPPENGDGTVVTLARGAAAGALSPRALTPTFAPDDYGVPLDAAWLRVFRSGEFEPIFEQTWGDALVGEGSPSIVPDHDYTVVWLGPHPAIIGLVSGASAPRFAIVENGSVDAAPDAGE